MCNEVAGKTKHKLPDTSPSMFTVAKAVTLWKHFSPHSLLIVAVVAFAHLQKSVFPSDKPPFPRNEDDPDKVSSDYEEQVPLDTKLSWEYSSSCCP